MVLEDLLRMGRQRKVSPAFSKNSVGHVRSGRTAIDETLFARAFEFSIRNGTFFLGTDINAPGADSHINSIWRFANL